MIQKKICMLGAFAVGKTSLVRRFVESIFSEKYQSTVGVSIHKKTVQCAGQEALLLLWDIYGEDDFQKVRTSYLRGASGLLLVVDGTRRATLDVALGLRKMADESAGRVPAVLVCNKSDLEPDWEVEAEALRSLEQQGWSVVRASAKSGAGVEEAFTRLTAAMLEA
jgi:hypothetical protein